MVRLGEGSTSRAGAAGVFVRRRHAVAQQFAVSSAGSPLFPASRLLLAPLGAVELLQLVVRAGPAVGFVPARLFGGRRNLIRGGVAVIELSREAEKLAAYADGEPITAEMVDALVPRHPDAKTYELADAIVPHQYVGAAVPYPDYVGGYRGGTGPGVPSATYNEGVLDALDVAKRTGDRERMARYQRAGLLAALFTLRLQLTEDSAYYVANPERALGAFRASLVDGALRIDHTQHALNSFLKAERHLFGSATGARPWSEVVHAPSPS